MHNIVVMFCLSFPPILSVCVCVCVCMQVFTCVNIHANACVLKFALCCFHINRFLKVNLKNVSFVYPQDMQNVTVSYIHNVSCIHKSCNNGHSQSHVSRDHMPLNRCGTMGIWTSRMTHYYLSSFVEQCSTVQYSILQFTITVPHGHLQLRHAFWLCKTQNITYQEMQENIRGLSGKYPATLIISRTVHVPLM
jgi:hypothetical protein